MKNLYDLRKSLEKNEVEMEQLVGATVLEAFTNITNSVVRFDTNQGIYLLKWKANCCANCYLAHVSGVENLVGSTISGIRNSEWIYLRMGDREFVEHMGTTITTQKGYVDLETRVEHNGYYSGRIEVYKIDDLNLLTQAHEDLYELENF